MNNSNNRMKMKTMLMLAAGLAMTTAQADDAAPVSANATNHFRITGMHCDGCARGIQSELKHLPGVVSADVNFSNKLAVVACDTNRVSVDQLKKAVVEAGYDAKFIKPPETSRH